MAVTAVRVWRVSLDQDGDPHRWLSEEEQARAARYATPEEGRRFAVARAALRSVLAEAYDVAPDELVLGAEARGRPVIVPCDGRQPPDFNLSHAGCWALIAVAPPGWRVGVDVEWTGREVDCLAMARSMFQPAETARLADLDADERRAEFFRLWTAKEAYVKADGAGLAGLRHVRVDAGTTEVAGLRCVPVDTGTTGAADLRCVPADTGTTEVADLRCVPADAGTTEVAGLRCVRVDAGMTRSSAPSAGFPALLPVSWFEAAPGYRGALVVSRALAS